MSVSLFLSGCPPAANIQAKFIYISNRFARRALWMSMWWEPCSRPIQLNKIYIIPIALRLVYKSQLFSHFRVAGWVTLYRLIHSQSTLSFLFSNCPSLFQFDRVQFVERAYREVSITTKLLIAWFTSTRGVYQFRTVKPVISSGLKKACSSIWFMIFACQSRIPIILDISLLLSVGCLNGRGRTSKSQDHW